MIVIDYVRKTFPDPIDQWALGEAQKVMEKYAMKKKGVSVFPVEKIHQLLSKVLYELQRFNNTSVVVLLYLVWELYFPCI